MPTIPASPAARRKPWFGVALLACVTLALAGGITQRHALGILAVLVLLAAWLPRVWRGRSITAFAAWTGLAALLLLPAGMGHPGLALMAVPVVFLALAAWCFARTLVRGREPVIARFIRVVDGPSQLALPRVRGYARGVTTFWAGLLAAMALLSLAIALFAQPGGWLATFGIATPAWVPGSLLAWYPELGCWSVLAVAFAGEYAFRRWYLRRVPQPGVWRFAAQMVRHWPALFRGEDLHA